MLIGPHQAFGLLIRTTYLSGTQLLDLIHLDSGLICRNIQQVLLIVLMSVQQVKHLENLLTTQLIQSECMVLEFGILLVVGKIHVHLMFITPQIWPILI